MAAETAPSHNKYSQERMRVVGDMNTTCAEGIQRWAWKPMCEEGEDGKQKACSKSLYLRIKKETSTTKDKEGESFFFEWLVDKDMITKKKKNKKKKKKMKKQLQRQPHSWGEGTLSPATPKMPSDVPEGSFSLALGSQIYVLGGIFPSSPCKASCPPMTHVFSFDLAHPEDCWKRGPHLNIGRFMASAVALDGKIYVLGGLYNYSDWGLPFTEVFDPAAHGEWKSLSPAQADPSVVPLDDGYGSEKVIVHPCVKAAHPLPNGRILFQASLTLVSYDVKADKYDLLDPLFLADCKGVAVLEDVLFSCKRYSGVCAYDLINRDWFSSPVRGLEWGSVLSSHACFNPFLLNLGGGRLCVVWYACLVDYPGKILIHSIIFRVNKTTPPDGGEPIFSASIEASKKYCEEGAAVVDCLAL